MSDILRVAVPDPLPEGVAVAGGLATFIIPNPDNPVRPRITTARVENGEIVLCVAKSYLNRLAAEMLGA